MKTLIIGYLTARIPIIQGGMGVGVSLSGLAGAVAACGGVGIISAAQIGYREPDFAQNPLRANVRALKAEICRARELSKGGGGLIGVNIMVAMRFYEEYVRAAVEAGADLIVSGAGLPVDLPRLVEGTRIRIAPIVSSLRALSVLWRLWERRGNRRPDLVVIEGPRAGGHLGFSPEELACPEKLAYDKQIREMVSFVREREPSLPVVAAGGIYHRADVEQAFSLGVDGVQVATRFVTTWECDASPAYKQAYLDAKKEDIVITASPVGMPGRAIRNAFLREPSHPVKACYQCLAHCKPKEIPYCITDALIQAVKGNTDQGLLFCGDNAWQATKIEHVSQVMEELAGSRIL